MARTCVFAAPRSNCSRKYLQLGRDATSSGDRVMAEGYFQHAEHYFRILNAINQAQQGQNPHPQQNGHNNQGYQGQRQNGDEPSEGGDDRGEDQPLVESRDIPIGAAQPEN